MSKLTNLITVKLMYDGVFVFVFLLVEVSFLGQVFAHGSMETPLSRIYNCRLENPESPKSAACRAAVEVGGTQAL